MTSQGATNSSCRHWVFTGHLCDFLSFVMPLLMLQDAADEDSFGTFIHKFQKWIELDQSIISIQLVGALSLVGPIGVQLLDFFCSNISVLVLSSSTHFVSSQCRILTYMFADHSNEVLLLWFILVVIVCPLSVCI